MYEVQIEHQKYGNQYRTTEKIESEGEFRHKIVMLQSQADSSAWSYRHGKHELKEILIKLGKTLKECLEYLENRDND